MYSGTVYFTQIFVGFQGFVLLLEERHGSTVGALFRSSGSPVGRGFGQVGRDQSHDQLLRYTFQPVLASETVQYT